MMYCKSRAMYYVQLEDDVITKPGYLSTMKNFAINQKTDDWLLLEFSHLGFIGQDIAAVVSLSVLPGYSDLHIAFTYGWNSNRGDC